MRAYVTTIGERTTDICVKQLQRLEFEVVLLDKVEPWHKKYQRFIDMLETPAIRIDADIIPNADIYALVNDNFCMVQGHTYCIYKNGLAITSPVYYGTQWTDSGFDNDRPEASCWKRQNNTFTSSAVVGFHGFYQDKEHLQRARKNKEERGQFGEYDFNVAELCLL